jgi:hypothetical protein
MTIIIKMNRNYDTCNLTTAKRDLLLLFEGSPKEYPHGEANHRSYDPDGNAARSVLARIGGADDCQHRGGASPAFGSIVTPRPINPATDTTNPSARATRTLNPYLGSTPEGNVVDGEIRISLEDAIARGLRFNLGLIDSQQADAGVRAEREHALSQLLPQISARAQQSYEQLSFKALNIKVPPQAGFQLPPTTAGFGYSEGDILAHSAVVNLEL